MSAPTANDIFDFLSGQPTEPGTPADRVRRAALDPAADPEAAAALAQFQQGHTKLHSAPRANALIDAFFQGMTKELAAEAKKPRPVAPVKPVRTWQDLFEELIAHCRTELATARAAPPVGTAQSHVTTTLTNYLADTSDNRNRDLHDPAQLWPVVLELTARQLRQPLTPATVANARFADALTTVLKNVFKMARDDRGRLIVAHLLLGKNPKQIAGATNDQPEAVRATIHSVHSDLHHVLAP